MMRHAPVQTAPNPKQAVRKGRRRLPRRTAARLRLLRRRAAAWKRQARRAATLALVGVMAAQAPLTAYGQFGQAPMGQSAGLANRAVARLGNTWQNLQNGPGYFYYGVNPADRGLGYIGSYMTLGGFIPLVEDDLGGVWNADIRSHLSVYGGFFSNVGAVRKQLLGNGSLLGVGVYWDYDGDLNQFPTGNTIGTTDFGSFGHVYNQVGVSGEWLTDWGNLRSNGYMPVGTTGYQLLTSNAPFFQNYIIAQNGLDAALGGADLEVGAYVPGLADWAGMINVGGYALGNTQYDTTFGPNAGKGIVPWFGGVYTRLDVSLANNWDFSIQANNDSYFDWTGFCRLTYRMGGSRRRNVPDQMEQPMFRNEHIVRAHETPIVAVNPQNNNEPWQVVHIDNSAAAGGDGTAEAPFRTLAQAQASPLIQSQQWTVAYLREGTSNPANPYTGLFTFQRPNQFLIGSGGPFTIAVQPSVSQGLLTIPALSASNPLLSNPGGPSVVIDGGVIPSKVNPVVGAGATIANLQITGSGIGIEGYDQLSSGTPQLAGTTANPFGTNDGGAASVNSVTISGDGTAAVQSGVQLVAAGGFRPTGAIDFYNTTIENMNDRGFAIGDGTASSGGDGLTVNYQGTITSNVASNGNVPSLLIDINNTANSTINLAAAGNPAGATVANRILDIGGEGILIEGNADSATINVGNTTLVNSVDTAIFVLNDNSTTSITTATDPAAGFNFGIDKDTDGVAIALSGGNPVFDFFGTVNNAPGAGSTSTSYIVQAENIGSNGDLTISGPGSFPLLDSGDGVRLSGFAGGKSSITGLSLSGVRPTGILVENTSKLSEFFFDSVTIANSTQQGILLTGLTAGGNSRTTFRDLDISLTANDAQGINATDAGQVLTTGANTLANGSATRAAIFVDGTTQLGNGTAGSGLNFTTVQSGNTEVAFGNPPTNTTQTPPFEPGFETAITLNETGGASGDINISSAFTVGAPPVTADGFNVNNGGGVDVNVSGTRISPP